MAIYKGVVMNSYQTEYLEVWKKAFPEFLGWREGQALNWSIPRLDAMAPPGMIINDPPLYYVAREIAYLQSSIDELSQSGRDDLIRDIEEILDPKNDRGFAPDYDFDKTRRKIESLLRHANPRK